MNNNEDEKYGTEKAKSMCIVSSMSKQQQKERKRKKKVNMRECNRNF